MNEISKHPYKSHKIYGLTLRPLIIFSLFLYMVLENVLISFFYMKLSSFPRATY